MAKNSKAPSKKSPAKPVKAVAAKPKSVPKKAGGGGSRKSSTSVAKKVVPPKAPAKKATASKATPAKSKSQPKAKPTKPPATKPPATKPPATKPPATKRPATKPAAKPRQNPPAKSAKPSKIKKEQPRPRPPLAEKKPVPAKQAAFFKKQRQRLLELKDVLLDSMNGVAKDTLRSRAEGSEGSAFGMHQADAGSDAYDRDFALSLLSSEQNSLYEIDEALKRIDDGTYGVCEISGKAIPRERLEALPFTRYTVECQAELEKQNRFRARVPVTSLFGLGDDDGDDDDDSSSGDNKD
jgi:RNA polymerase-binding transcription factor DksA